MANSINDIYLYDKKMKDASAYNIAMAYPACESFALSSLG